MLNSIRTDVSHRLVAFAWDQWSQMGVAGTPPARSRWAQDPEALMMFTLEVGRSDARLFDEMLDWAVTNSGLVNVQRLRNHVTDQTDPRLVEAVLATLTSRPGRLSTSAQDAVGLTVLFEGGRQPSKPDSAFAAYGFAKPQTKRTGNSVQPDLSRPINFAFRLRNTFGTGSRAEIMRFLLTATVTAPVGRRPLFTTAAVGEAAGFRKRNVHDALSSLAASGALERVLRGNENLYGVNVEKWHRALWVEDEPLPSYRDWTHALQGFAQLRRWLHQPDIDRWSPYILSSEARLFVGQIAPSFGYAGIPVSPPQDVEPAEYLPAFGRWTEQLLSALEGGMPW